MYDNNSKEQSFQQISNLSEHPLVDCFLVKLLGIDDDRLSQAQAKNMQPAKLKRTSSQLTFEKFSPFNKSAMSQGMFIFAIEL